ncbi:kinase-like domain-containing protein [Rhodocollybia butyracea]|uniref:Kinase-like domain-containing protein n=1 Tax=Rhodocollybia butyracea TaxID=206335 RepID=A0A9P5PB84_9AGAR|nr:kinase-like domain-containing protein [Rhodocollybia butyracea]
MRDLLLALDYCHRECKIIHTDVKSSNIIMQLNFEVTPSDFNPKDHETFEFNDKENGSCVITKAAPLGNFPDGDRLDLEWWRKNGRFKLMDFGVACFSDKVHEYPSDISAAALRAPEAFIQADWDSSVDIWSTGLTLFHLLTAHPLYPDGLDEKLLYPLWMYLVFGKFPLPLLEQSRIGGAWFSRETGLPHEEYMSGLPNDVLAIDELLIRLLELYGRPPPSQELLTFMSRMLV